jgi:hypothetical protein
VLEAEVVDNTIKPAISQVKIDISDVDANWLNTNAGNHWPDF